MHLAARASWSQERARSPEQGQLLTVADPGLGTEGLQSLGTLCFLLAHCSQSLLLQIKEHGTTHAGLWTGSRWSREQTHHRWLDRDWGKCVSPFGTEHKVPGD
jgi:hypothetical protein